MCLTGTALFSDIILWLRGERFRSTPVMDRGILLRAGKKPSFVQKTRRPVDWETELVNSFAVIVHRDFSNPQRIGCPGRDSLVGFAACREDAQSAFVLAHIR
jgi:hypothetical protein